MQIGPTQPPLWGPNPAGTYIGSAELVSDAENTTMMVVAAKLGDLVAMPNGYPTLDDAVTAARSLTAANDEGDRGAAAVFAKDDRFYAAEVLVKTLVGGDPGGTDRWTPFEFEYNSGGEHDGGGEWGFTSTKHLVANNVLAVLDGETDLYSAEK